MIIKDITDKMMCLSIFGSEYRKLLASMTEEDVLNKNLPFLGFSNLEMGLVSPKVGRITVSGELGFGINTLG